MSEPTLLEMDKVHMAAGEIALSAIEQRIKVLCEQNRQRRDEMTSITREFKDCPDGFIAELARQKFQHLERQTETTNAILGELASLRTVLEEQYDETGATAQS